MLAVRFEEVVSRGAGAAVALFSGAVIREMYRTKILSVKVCPPTRTLRYLSFLRGSPLLVHLHLDLGVPAVYAWSTSIKMSLNKWSCCHVADGSHEISNFQ